MGFEDRQQKFSKNSNRSKAVAAINILCLRCHVVSFEVSSTFFRIRFVKELICTFICLSIYIMCLHLDL